MAADERWYFTKEQLASSPSRRCGIDADKELSYRQQAANFIQDMGQRLTVSQLCINTAIVYMHRFYVFHSLTHFHRNAIAAAALFLAAKVEEQPRKLEHVIKVAHLCLHRDAPILDVKSDQYLDQAADLVFNENVLLQTLAFDVAIDHPHTHVVRCCHLVKASKDLAQTSYFMASNSLHLTTMCLQYKPTVVACFCIHLACKWSNWEIPVSNEGKDWFWYVDKTVTWEQLSQLTSEFLHIFDKCPSRLRRKIRSISAGQSPNMPHPVNSPFESEPRKVQSPVNADGTTNFTSSRPFKSETSETDGSKVKPSTSSSSGRTTVGLDDYREKRERMNLEREKAAARASTSVMSAPAERHHSHHHKMGAANSSLPNKHSSSSSTSGNARQNVHHNHHHNSRQDVKQQMMAQRHSSSSQSRDPNRERQRMPSGYHSNSSSSSSSHPADEGLANNLNSTSDATTVHPPEKLSNNVPHNNRAMDPRHPKQQQQAKDAKAYGKYPDSRQARKPDILEQRSEEVRKLIEKPLPPPKPRAEQIKEEYAAMMLKKSHQPPKYGHQPEKPLPNSNSAAMADSSKMLNVSQNAFTVDKSPNAPVSASQVSHKSQMMPMKNGSTSATSSFSLGTLDDPKAEKRPRAHEQVEQPVKQHRSLFSPEKTIAPPPQQQQQQQQQQPQQQQRSKAKSKTVPEPNAEMLAFAGSNSMSQASSDLSQQQQQQLQRLANNAAQQKQQQQMQSMEQFSRKFISSFSEAAMPGNNRLPDLVKSMKDGRTSLPLLEAAKQPPPEMIKPLDDPIIPNQRYKQQQQQQHHHGLSNGLDSSYSKQEYSTIDPSSFLMKTELPDQLLAHEEPPMPKLDNYMYQGSMMKNELLSNELDLSSSIKRESFSPLKSAQSISALLQEPLAPMPSLLQQVPSYEQQQQQHQHQQQQQQQHQHQPPPEVKVETSLPSTVDMSELVAPIQCDVEVPAAVKVEVPSSEDKDKKDSNKEHRSKSEKKKKKEKHRHKDKDKSKEKHKHKHKDKDKEKHRRDKSSKEKDKTDEGNGQASGASAGNSSLGSLSAVPIKITIPKDKLNLSTESIGSSTTSSINSAAASNNGSTTTTSSSSLKIKIPKERLKGAISPAQQLQQQQMSAAAAQLSSVQAAPPLKLKIRKDTLDSQQQQQLASQQHLQQQLDAAAAAVAAAAAAASNRKRDRSDEGSSLPTAKKHQQQRPSERQNGRHSYPSNSTNKPDRYSYESVELLTDSGDVAEGLPRNFVPTSYGSSPPIYF